jgi:hypothetical protein
VGRWRYRAGGGISRQRSRSSFSSPHNATVPASFNGRLQQPDQIEGGDSRVPQEIQNAGHDAGQHVVATSNHCAIAALLFDILNGYAARSDDSPAELYGCRRWVGSRLVHEFDKPAHQKAQRVQARLRDAGDKRNGDAHASLIRRHMLLPRCSHGPAGRVTSAVAEGRAGVEDAYGDLVELNFDERRDKVGRHLEAATACNKAKLTNDREHLTEAAVRSSGLQQLVDGYSVPSDISAAAAHLKCCRLLVSLESFAAALSRSRVALRACKVTAALRRAGATTSRAVREQEMNSSRSIS